MIVGESRHVRLFRNGRNQAVRIPREFEFDSDEAIMRRDGKRLILEPVPKGNLLDVLRALGPLPMSKRIESVGVENLCCN